MEKDKYQEALERARTIYLAYDCGNRDLEYIFPELVENEDEKIWEQIKSILEYHMQESFSPEWKQKCLEWLEKRKPLFPDQDQRDPWEYIEKFKSLYGHYPKDADEIGVIVSEMIRKQKPNESEPKKKDDHKFKEDDWVITNDGDKIRHILEVSPGGYTSDQGWLSKDTYEGMFRLWTIQDAKPGDILSWDNERYTIIFKELENQKTIVAYCSYNSHDDSFVVSGYNTRFDIDLKFRPASEGARKALLKKIVDSNYHWDPDSLELSKMPEYSPELWDNTDKDMARFIGNAITTDEASAYLKEKHIEVIDAHVWLESLKDRVNSNWGVNSEQCNALMRTIANSKIMSSKDAGLLMNLHNRLTAE